MTTPVSLPPSIFIQESSTWACVSLQIHAPYLSNDFPSLFTTFNPNVQPDGGVTGWTQPTLVDWGSP